jgi:flagellar biosynthesis/type III secretory pathway protein FliH
MEIEKDDPERALFLSRQNAEREQLMFKAGRLKGMTEGREQAEREHISKLLFFEARGRMGGLIEGLEKGRAEVRKEVISLIEKGVPLDEIKKILSEKQPSKDT